MLKKILLLACAAALLTVPAHAGKPAAPVKITADVPTQLMPGEKGVMVVTFVPLVATEQVKVDFRGGNGLVVLSPATSVFVAPAVGAPLTQQVEIMAGSEGRYYLTATVTTASEGRSLGRVISIPVPIGDAARQKKPHVEPALPVDATGERIKSLPAAQGRGAP